MSVKPLNKKTLKHIESYLSRYLDGELSPEETRIVKSRLQSEPELQKTLDALGASSREIEDALAETEPMNVVTLRLQQFLTTLPQTQPEPTGGWLGRLKTFFANPMKLKYAGLAASFVILALLIVPTMIQPHLNVVRDEAVKYEYGAFSLGFPVQEKGRDKGVSRGEEVRRGLAAGRYVAGDNVERYREGVEELPALGRTVTRYKGTSAGQQKEAFGFSAGVGISPAPTSDVPVLGDIPVLGGLFKGKAGRGRMSYDARLDPLSVGKQVQVNGAVSAYIQEKRSPVNAEERVRQQDSIAVLVQAPDALEDADINGDGKETTAASGDFDGDREDDVATTEEARKVIRNANMLVEVEVLSDAQSTVERVVSESGGLTAQLTLREKEKPPWAQYTLWIPAQRLDAALEEFKKLGEVQHVEVAIQDITEQYFDRETRIKNLQRQEERLLKLYERDTVKMEELLKVEQEIARIRTDVEKMQGQQRMWDRQIQYSTLTLNLRQKPEEEPIVKSEPNDVFTPIRRAFIDAAAVVMYSCSLAATLVAWMFSFALFVVPWIVIAFAVRFGWKKWGRR